MDTKIKKSSRNIYSAVILLMVLLLTKSIEILPWWFFIIPVLVTGMIIALKGWKVHGLLVGFLTGFIVWIGANLYFSLTSEALILSRFGLLAGAITLLASGILGGVLTGLALYTGKSIFSNKRKELTL